MSLTVLEPGLHSLLVDAGRPRSRHLGVPLGGAADRAALAVGNAAGVCDGWGTTSGGSGGDIVVSLASGCVVGCSPSTAGGATEVGAGVLAGRAAGAAYGRMPGGDRPA